MSEAFLSREESQKILNSHGQPEGSSWKSHSQLVCQNAYILASTLRDRGHPIQEEYVSGAALLHDLGRSVTHGESHGWEGYKILKRMGLAHYGRFCITHWLKGRTLEEALEDNSLSREDLEEIFQETTPQDLSLEDKVVILADGMASGERLVTVEDRCREWEDRYGKGLWVQKNRELLTKIKEEIEGLLDKKIEEVFFRTSPLTHLDEEGAARMVDISHKVPSERRAIAQGVVRMKGETLKIALENRGKKGDAFQVARVGAIMAAKRTWELIPLCHPLPLTSVEIDFEFPDETRVQIIGIAKTTYGTGVEMEALTAVSVAALTLYDMLKAVDKTMEIGEIRLVKKTGGKSGDFEWLPKK